MCWDVSFCAPVSETTMPSSKLYPLYGRYATRRFFPRARVPPLVKLESATSCPDLTSSPTFTTGLECRTLDASLRGKWS